MSLPRSCLCTLLCASLAACSSRPSVSDVRAAVSKQLDGGKDERIVLKDVSKTDGQQGELLGVPIYELDFKASAELTADAYYTTGSAFTGTQATITTWPTSSPPKTCGQDFASCFSATPHLAHKGDRLTLVGNANFEKHDSGWQLGCV